MISFLYHVYNIQSSLTKLLVLNILCKKYVTSHLFVVTSYLFVYCFIGEGTPPPSCGWPSPLLLLVTPIQRLSSLSALNSQGLQNHLPYVGGQLDICVGQINLLSDVLKGNQIFVFDCYITSFLNVSNGRGTTKPSVFPAPRANTFFFASTSQT